MSLQYHVLSSSAPVTGVRVGVRSAPAPFAYTLTKLVFSLGSPAAGDATFDFRIGGVSVFAPSARPVIPAGQRSVTVSGLLVAGAASDILSWDAVAVPLGGLPAPVTCTAVLDDGLGVEAVEADGSPDVLALTRLVVGNGDLTNLGGGAVRVLTAADAYAAVMSALTTGGLIKPSLLPALALNSRVSVNSQAAMLALTASDVQPGDFAFRTDVSEVYLLMGDDPSVLSNWVQWLHPAAVTSLAMSGDVGGTTDSNALALILAASGTSNAAGTYGDATHVPVVTVDRKGRVTGISVVSSTGGGGGAPTGAASGDLGDAYPGPTVVGLKKRTLSGLPPPVTVADNFDDNARNADLWNLVASANAVAEQNARLEFGGNVGTAFGNYASVAQFDLTGHYVRVRFVGVISSGTTDHYVLLGLTNGNAQIFWAYDVAGNVVARSSTLSGTLTTRATIAYNSAVHVFFRIRESGGTVYWDWSTDGSSWTNAATMAVNTASNPVTGQTIVIGAVNGVTSIQATGRVAVDDFTSDLPDPIAYKNLYALGWDDASNRLGLLRTLGILPTTSGAPSTTPSDVPAGYVLRMYDPASGIYYVWTGSAWVTETRAIDNASGQSVLSADHAITSGLTVFEDIGLSVALPSAGTYLLHAEVYAQLNVTAAGSGQGAYIVAKLYNSTDAADVANSETLILYFEEINTYRAATSHITSVVTVTAAKTIKLYAYRSASGSASFTSSVIRSTSAGRTRLTYLKVS